MGDMAKKTTTAEKIAARDERKKETVQLKNTTIETLAQRPIIKDKMISLRLNSSNYAKFKSICQTRGFSVNACINMLVSDFIKDNMEFIN